MRIVMARWAVHLSFLGHGTGRLCTLAFGCCCFLCFCFIFGLFPWCDSSFVGTVPFRGVDRCSGGRAGRDPLTRKSLQGIIRFPLGPGVLGMLTVTGTKLRVIEPVGDICWEALGLAGTGWGSSMGMLHSPARSSVGVAYLSDSCVLVAKWGALPKFHARSRGRRAGLGERGAL
ncbi:hypothetical protein GQ53DRAFT_68588 [Thozetella sp. PMI_491]|nr:hypothetical protein GQ53DRAFT_68588 [Thozetella sp. PMI_491]